MKHSWCSGGRSVVVHLYESSDCIGKIIKKPRKLKKNVKVISRGEKVVTNISLFLNCSEVHTWNMKVQKENSPLCHTKFQLLHNNIFQINFN